jgi:hypothetical protein
MENRILEILSTDWQLSDCPNDNYWAALEAGKVLYFPKLKFDLVQDELRLFTPAISDPKSRNISLDADGRLKGALGSNLTQTALAQLMARFRDKARMLIDGLAPRYSQSIRLSPTSYRPIQVETRAQSWRADDRRLHIDAFPSRPNYGERILRVFINVNQSGEPRVWRVGEPFELIAKRFIGQAKKYSRWQAGILNALHITKSFRSEYDHLMLQLHDCMKSDHDYQKNSQQVVMPFPAGSVWVCFSDQVSHAVMSGQYMMEQTFNLPVDQQYHPDSSPLAILTRLTGRALV